MDEKVNVEIKNGIWKNESALSEIFFISLIYKQDWIMEEVTWSASSDDRMQRRSER